MATGAQEHKRAFLEFIEQAGYSNTIHAMIDNGKSRLMLSLDDLRSFDTELTNNFMRRPADYLPAFEDALRETVDIFDSSVQKQATSQKFRIGVVGAFGSHHVSPRKLTSNLLNTLVYVEGIVTKCTLVRPKVIKSTHWCPATKKYTSKEYRDHTSLTGTMTGSAYPQKDQDGNPLETEFGLSEYLDNQVVTLQEMPERAPPGQLPRSIEVLLEADLVDTAKPGDRLQVAGIHRALPSKSNQSGMFRTIVIGNNVVSLTKHTGSSEFTAEDIENMKGLSRKSDCLEQLSESLAPSIFGHEYEKRALLLMLLGGAERNLANGTHLRGDINVLMLGDPGTAKSQLLRAVMRTAPLAISTTGRGSSGVGLTAAVTVDSDTGTRRLEAGAMVLADRGVCCVDEFDKMLDADRVAIHEVMEQQTVTISKAGIHASLNARCAVVAAANPIFGSYNPNMPPMQNIAMPDSLLSRFDLLFVILDKKEAESDRRISHHVLRQHCSRFAPPPADMSGIVGASAASSSKTGSNPSTEMYARVDARTLAPGEEIQERLTADFIKKYIQYAKKKVDAPTLSEEATSHICEAYAALRERMAGSRGRTLPITARTLETMIRLSAAHAKCHLRGLVNKADAEAAVALLNYALLKDDDKDGAKDSEDPDRRDGGGGGDDDVGGGDDDEDPKDSDYRPSGSVGKRPRGTEGGSAPEQPKRHAKGGASSSQSRAAQPQSRDTETTDEPALAEDEDFDDLEDVEAAAMSDERVAKLCKKVSSQVLGREDVVRESLSVGEMLAEVRQRVDASLTKPELKKLLEVLEAENKAMTRGGTVHVI